MRFALVGIFQLVFVSLAFAGISGRVDAIGFSSYVRPDCWVPLNVQIDSDATTAEEYELQVVQHDLNGDEVVYTRPVTVNPGRQMRWTYFKPESINGGIPANGTSTSFDLAKRIRIFLAAPSSKKRVVQISTAGRLPQALEHGALERIQVGQRSNKAGQRLAVVIGRQPQMREFDVERGAVEGLLENLIPVSINDPRNLPDSAIGYQMVDAIIWTDLSPSQLDPAQLRAVRQYVRGGGQLIVLQNAEAARMEGLNDLLPVRVGSIEQRDTSEPLKSILEPQLGESERSLPRDLNGVPYDAFKDVSGPFRVARAEALPGTLVEAWMGWPDGKQTPYIARHLYGNGTVAWVAQDLSDPTVTRVSFGWPRIWETIFGWRDTGMKLVLTAASDRERDTMRQRFTSTGYKNVGAPFINGLNLDSKTAALISLTFVFFIGYWLIVGPLSYVVLAARGRSQWSWFVYGGIALLAVVLTIGITKLVLRGSAEIKHLSLVRTTNTPGVSAHVLSRFGVYVPEDRTTDPAPITLTRRDESAVSTLAPFTLDPRYVRDSVNLRDTRYEVPIVGQDTGEAVTVDIPFRATLKKLQADWTGESPGQVTGQPVIPQSNTRIGGMISNNTGRDLSNVLMIFRDPKSPWQYEDQIIFKRAWPKGQTIDLAQQWSKADPKIVALGNGTSGIPLTGDLRRGSWAYVQEWLYQDLRASMFNEFEDSSAGFARSFPIVSLFGRLTPMSNFNPENPDRTDLLRRGMRQWDCSNAVAAGALVILAQSQNDQIPLPLTVDGEAPKGVGTTFWQFILPIDRTGFDGPPATQPADDEAQSPTTAQPESQQPQQ